MVSQHGTYGIRKSIQNLLHDTQPKLFEDFMEVAVFLGVTKLAGTTISVPQKIITRHEIFA